MIALMSGLGFVIFETALGACALAWSASGVCGVRFPHPDRGAVAAEARRAWPQARLLEPPSEVAAVVADVKALTAGEPRDFGDVAIDLSGVPDFQRRVYDLARAIPCGQTLTYGDVAARIGAPGAARAVGEALGRNPVPILVPCHRVLAAGGRRGGFSAPGGVAAKMRLLQIEGALALERLPLFAPQASSVSRK